MAGIFTKLTQAQYSALSSVDEQGIYFVTDGRLYVGSTLIADLTVSALGTGSDGQVLTLSGGLPSWATMQMGTWTGNTELNFYSGHAAVFFENQNGDDGNSGYIDTESGGMNILSSSDLNITCQNSGIVYIDTNVNCSGDITAASFINASDRSLKNHIENVRLSLEGMASIPLAAFTMKADETKTRRLGAYAQDVKKVIPEAVHTTKDGKYALDYGCLSTALVLSLIQEVKELKQRITELENR